MQRRGNRKQESAAHATARRSHCWNRSQEGKGLEATACKSKLKLKSLEVLHATARRSQRKAKEKQGPKGRTRKCNQGEDGCGGCGGRLYCGTECACRQKYTISLHHRAKSYVPGHVTFHFTFHHHHHNTPPPRVGVLPMANRATTNKYVGQ